MKSNLEVVTIINMTHFSHCVQYSRSKKLSWISIFAMPCSLLHMWYFLLEQKKEQANKRNGKKSRIVGTGALVTQMFVLSFHILAATCLSTLLA